MNPTGVPYKLFTNANQKLAIIACLLNMYAVRTKLSRHLICGVVLSLAVPVALAQSSPAPAQNAGKITALISPASIERGPVGKVTKSDAKRGAGVLWNDAIATDEDGRARVLLNDQSIISVGSKSRVVVVKHDATLQQTAIEMTYGHLRAQVSEITRNGGSFEIRTPTSVAGVIGTDFMLDVDENGESQITCLKGKVRVRSSDSRIRGEQIVAEGQTTRVRKGMRPVRPHPAPKALLERKQKDTEVPEHPEKEKGKKRNGERAHAKKRAKA